MLGTEYFINYLKGMVSTGPINRDVTTTAADAIMREYIKIDGELRFYPANTMNNRPSSYYLGQLGYDYNTMLTSAKEPFSYFLRDSPDYYVTIDPTDLARLAKTYHYKRSKGIDMKFVDPLIGRAADMFKVYVFNDDTNNTRVGVQVIRRGPTKDTNVEQYNCTGLYASTGGFFKHGSDYDNGNDKKPSFILSAQRETREEADPMFINSNGNLEQLSRKQGHISLIAGPTRIDPPIIDAYPDGRWFNAERDQRWRNGIEYKQIETLAYVTIYRVKQGIRFEDVRIVGKDDAKYYDKLGNKSVLPLLEVVYDKANKSNFTISSLTGKLDVNDFAFDHWNILNQAVKLLPSIIKGNNGKEL